MGYDAQTRLSVLRDDPAAESLLRRALPGALDSPTLSYMRFVTIGTLAHHAGADDQALAQLWSELAALPGSVPPAAPEQAPILPDPDYESDAVVPASAGLRPIGAAAVWGIAEIVLDGPSHGNPFVDVELSATFTNEAGVETVVGGFYDGDGVYRIRYQPQSTGRVDFTISSTARSLAGIRGSFEVAPAPETAHGPVEVADTFHFAYRDGTRFIPVGTTAYAWTHQDAELQERTLATLATAPFRKMRMGVFPKSYLFNTNEPELFAFERNADGEWDFTRFNPAFFAHLEKRIEQLAELGIETDLILFHPYDRWGFAEMPKVVDDRYVQYLVRRLGAHASVWWSLANEYDLVLSKSIEDWERIAAVVGANDHVGHLTSIHNCFGFYDHTRPWITHCSIQRTDVYRTAENTDAWREEYRKPIVIDECAYEGDIDQGWGNVSGQELVRRFWEGAVRGGYVGHGETYLNDREELWWSKGGDLVGDSPDRIRFLLEITDAAPAGVLDPLPSEWDVRWGGTPDYRIAYFGFGRPRFRDIALPPNSRWTIDIIDTWNMTIERLDGDFAGYTRVTLPGREYLALRIIRVSD